METYNGNYCVYCHTNIANGKKYVGMSKNIEKRWSANGYGYKTQIFYRAIEKYGWDGFYHEVIASNLTKEEAESFEILLISKLKTTDWHYGYNVDGGGHVRAEVTPETRKKISDGNKGKPAWNKGMKMDDEFCRKCSERMIGKYVGSKNPNYGKHFRLTEEQKISRRLTSGRAKRVLWDGVEYRSIAELSRCVDIPESTLRRWLLGTHKIPKKYEDKGLKYAPESQNHK